MFLPKPILFRILSGSSSNILKLKDSFVHMVTWPTRKATNSIEIKDKAILYFVDILNQTQGRINMLKGR